MANYAVHRCKYNPHVVTAKLYVTLVAFPNAGVAWLCVFVGFALSSENDVVDDRVIGYLWDRVGRS